LRQMQCVLLAGRPSSILRAVHRSPCKTQSNLFIWNWTQKQRLNSVISLLIYNCFGFLHFLQTKVLGNTGIHSRAVWNRITLISGKTWISLVIDVGRSQTGPETWPCTSVNRLMKH
jgi:hypothetical protein